MNSELKTEIDAIVSTLKQEGKVHLAKAIEENWDKTLLEYSKYINSYSSDLPMEDIFKIAISQELDRLGYQKQESEEIINFIEKNRVLQTGPHISPSGKPRYFFIDWLASIALDKNDFFGVAMFSGVPFSNKTRPGRLCSKNEDINLIPSNMQNELVYRNKIPEKMADVIKSLPEVIQKKLPEIKVGDSYTAWALESSKRIEGKFLKGKPVFFDFNEVVSNYLKLAIKNSSHPISKILFSKSERDTTINNFKDMVFFYGNALKDKHKETENFFLKDGYLESASRRIELNAQNLLKELEEGLCPGLIVGFFIISFLNRFRCFGSFAQVEYLPLYRDKFATFDFLKQYKIDEAPAGALTTGGFKDDTNLHVLDLALIDENTAKETLAKYENTLFGEAILAIKDVLLRQNYSMNLVRK